MANLNKAEASFSINNYFLDKIVLDLEKRKGEEINIDIRPKGSFYRKDSSFKLIFDFNTYSNGMEYPFISIRCTGTFKFQNVVSLEDIPPYFYTNCIALLFPYLRAFISIVTMQANIAPLILPILNLSSLAEPLKENTKEI